MILKQIAKMIYYVGGSTLLMRIGVVALSPFFEYLHMWPADEEQVKVILFASNEFFVESFLSSWRGDVN